MNTLDRIDVTQLCPKVLALFPTTQAIYLFGSHVSGSIHEQSDLDLALLLPSHRAFTSEPARWWQLQDELMTLFNRSVDLINLRQSSTVFQVEILRTGRRIYCIDLQLCNEYEGLILSLYQKLNEERAEILSSIRETGIIYG